MNERDEKTMNELLEKLAGYRIALGACQEIRTKILEEAQKHEQYVSAGTVMNETKALIEKAERKIRELALAYYEVNHDKHPHQSVEVKVFKTFKVVDPVKVGAWVANNLRDALTVDIKKVEKYALNIGAVDGAETGEEPRVQIATKL